MLTAVKEAVVMRALSNRREIVEALKSTHEDGVEYWSQFETTTFFAVMGSHWSPAEHVRHLTRSMSPLLSVLRVPRVALRMAFGPATAPSRSFEQIAGSYGQALARGGTAGRYTPSPEHESGDDARRNAIMDHHSETLRGVTQGMERWTETELDAHRLPHPLMGKLTVREMMLFTLLHNRHHVQVAERRLQETGARR